MASVTSTGLGSGIDVNALVTKLVSAEQTPAANRLDRQEAGLQAKISALGSIKGALSDFQTAFNALKNSGSFSSLQATSGDSAVMTATAAGSAEAASYQLKVKQLAQAQGLASKAYTNASDTVGTGTITIKFGTTSYSGTPPVPSGFTQNADKGTLTLTLDSSNNTLTGLRDAINEADAGVKAAIVNDGTGYRLVLNSADSGVKNSMEITTAGDAGLAEFAYNATSQQMTQTMAAQDAIVNINGLDVTSSTNTVSSALKGLTLNLLKAQPDTAVSLTVAQNDANITKAIQGMVDKFNAVADAVKNVASYNATTKKAGALSGDFTVQGAMSQLRSLISRPVEGLTGSVRSLIDIGIKTQADGKLALDTGKLNQALASSRDDVIALFAPVGLPSDSGVSHVSATDKTQAGTYALNVGSAATHGALNGAASPSLVVDGTNDTLQLKLDGVSSGTITFTQGTYSDTATLAAELQSRINGDSALKAGGVSVSVSYETDHFVLRSQSYGSASNVEITQVGGGSTATVGGLGVAAGTAGADAQATLDGNAMTASGRQLTGSGNADGLKLLLNDDATGSRGTVRFTRGLAEQFDKVLSGILGSGGTVASRLEGWQKSVDKIGDERTRLAERMDALQTRLLKQFNAMDALVGQFTAIGNYMSQQLATLPYAMQANSKN